MLVTFSIPAISGTSSDITVNYYEKTYIHSLFVFHSTDEPFLAGRVGWWLPPSPGSGIRFAGLGWVGSSLQIHGSLPRPIFYVSVGCWP